MSQATSAGRWALVLALLLALPTVARAEAVDVAACDRPHRAGKLHGKTLCWSRAGMQVLEQDWLGGRKHGVERIWHARTGQLISDADWRDGDRHGIFDLYNPMIVRQVEHREYRRGELEGRQQVWDVTSGQQLLADLRWKRGRQTGFINHGAVEEQFRQGKLHGVRRLYAIADPRCEAIRREARELVVALGGGGYFLGLLPGSRVVVEEVYDRGVRIARRELAEGNPGCQSDRSVVAQPRS